VSPTAVCFTGAGLRRGFIAAQALALGVFAYGVAFGMLATGAGVSGWQAVAMSATINSSSAQTVAVNAMLTGVGLFATVTSVLMLNARYVFYGAAIRPWLGAVGGSRAWMSLFVLGDGNWVLAMRAHEAGERDAAYLAGAGLVMLVAWLLGTVFAGLFGQLIARPEALGLDFLLAAFCMAAAVEAARARPDGITLRCAVAALGAAGLVDQLGASHWATVAAGMAAIGVAWWADDIPRAQE
jgi:predicted branched-subunit amino acid permease